MLKKILILMAVVLAAAACKKEPHTPTPLPSVNTYTGTARTTQADDTVFEHAGVAAEFTLDDNTGKMTMKLNKVRFAAAMPVEIDMVVNDLGFTRGEESVSFRGEELIPLLANGTPFPMYTIHTISGTLTAEKAEFTSLFGTFPVTFTATKQNK